MADTRFCSASSNKLLRYDTAATYPRIINGDSVNYTSPPALQQEAAFPMSNIHNPSRYLPWVSPIGSTPSPLILHVDMGADISPTFVGFHGLRWFGAGADVTAAVGYRTQAGGYAVGGPWTSFSSGTITANSRDKGFLATGTGRYWEFKFSGSITPGLSFGSIYLGVITSTMTGMVYSPGAQEELIHPLIESRNAAQHLVTTAIGDDRYLATLPFRALLDAERAKIDAVFGPGTVRDPAVWLNHADVARQVVLARGSMAWVHEWAPPNRWGVDLELEVLG